MNPIAWEHLSPREIFEALKKAPKVAGPWTDMPDAYNMEARYDHKNRLVCCRPKTENLPAWEQALIKRITAAHPNINGGETREECDAELRRRGFLLVDE